MKVPSSLFPFPETQNLYRFALRNQYPGASDTIPLRLLDHSLCKYPADAGYSFHVLYLDPHQEFITANAKNLFGFDVIHRQFL